ncbi:SGNH/GDSL hydrolase family protein [Plectonema radiosum NIES-515]|uniref:SGNH/GDSL hydrolase family protein n=1 Tax=Plectonema radiosum NIES-515 TaxID=2986073 RepID=A0ABT3B7Q2_9CYAN|nr:SGNH/GDSL hydrolase family protein [Plectonema radiosum]MCV3217369.1 SGNH/GDSL hydrolase family protein [Plectonema radiosum NIES-515]
MTKLNRWATVALTAVLILTGLLVGLGIIEIGLRIAGIEYPAFYVVDEHRGWVGQPNVSGWYRTEGESYAQFNSDGFRDGKHTKVKPENTLRIALLGDSMVEALQVPFSQGFGAITERELSTCPTLAGQKVEVINFGISGYGTAQELITLREKVWNYSPDIVLLAFLTLNDVIDNSHSLSQKLEFDQLFSLRPYFIMKNGNLVFDTTENDRSKNSWWNKNYAKIKSHLRILQLFNQLRTDFRGLPTVKKSTVRDLQSIGVEERVKLLSWGHDVYKQPTDPDWQQAWQVTEGLISLMHHEVIAKGADFTVVTLSGFAPVYPDPSVRQQYMQAFGVTDLFYPEKRITDLGEKSGFSVLNLGEPFQAYADQNKVCVSGFAKTGLCGGHWNAVGHELAGKMIASKLCEKLTSIASNQVQ